MSDGGNPLIKLDEKEGKPIYVSRRELTLRYEIPVGEIHPFFKGLEEGKVLASQCSSCGAFYFPPQGACPKCGADKMLWVDVSGEAELLAYTQIFVKPKSFAQEKPYFVGVARLRQGVNVLAKIVVEDPKSVKVGMKLRLCVEREDGVPVYVLKQQA